MPLVVGVDAGGSRTEAAAQRDQGPPRTFVGAGANPNVGGLEQAVDAIAAAVIGVAGTDRPDAIAVGAAGAGRSEIVEAMTAALRARFPGTPIGVSDDARIALRGAVPTGDGFVLVAGTGSLAYGEIGDRAFRAGGGGFALGEEGSGYAIGSAALKLVLRSLEGRAPRDPLIEALVMQTGASGIAQLISYTYAGGTPVRSVAAVASTVIRLADNGERSAVRIVQGAALELFELIRAVCRQAGMPASDLPIALSGGLVRSNSLLTYLIETRIANELPHLRIVKNGGPPYLGALAAAWRLLA